MESNSLQAATQRPGPRLGFLFILAFASVMLFTFGPLFTSGTVAHAANLAEPETTTASTRLTLIRLPSLHYGSAASDNGTAGSVPALDSDLPLRSPAVVIGNGSGAGAATADAILPNVVAADSVDVSLRGRPVGSLEVPAMDRGVSDSQFVSPPRVPEPASILLIGVASLGLYFVGRHWSRKH